MITSGNMPSSFSDSPNRLGMSPNRSGMSPRPPVGFSSLGELGDAELSGCSNFSSAPSLPHHPDAFLNYSCSCRALFVSRVFFEVCHKIQSLHKKKLEKGEKIVTETISPQLNDSCELCSLQNCGETKKKELAHEKSH